MVSGEDAALIVIGYQLFGKRSEGVELLSC